MINSMTAFAREQGECSQGTLVVELRSVNHRYLECYFKLPEQLRTLENSWREHLRKKLARGKVECQIRWQAESQQAPELNINLEQLDRLASALRQVETCVAGLTPTTALDILAWPGVMDSAARDEDEVLALAERVMKTALQTLIENRGREGTQLTAAIGQRLRAVTVQVALTRQQLPQLLQQQQQRIEKRLQEIGAELEPQRLEQELVLIANKADVEEELDRLSVHVQEVTRVLEKGGPCGRRLDFLMQELNREANTLSSKSIASSTTQNAVELKVLIEQMREQIQNLE